jgi:high-affinity iron transporter
VLAFALKMKFIFKMTGALLLLGAPLAGAAPAAPSPLAADGGNAQRLVLLLDYVAADYGVAVKDGVVLSADEYAEQLRFMADAREIVHDLAGADDPLVKQVEAVAALLEAKAAPTEVAAACQAARGAAVTRFSLPTAPAARPSLEQARALYAQACAVCHGATGDGNGTQARLLDPAPANFRDPERLQGLSPYRAYNALTFGVPGTGMASFELLPAGERWSLAFYVFRLGHEGRPLRGPQSRPLGELSSRTDGDLLAALRAEGEADPEGVLSHLRVETPFQEPLAGAGVVRTRSLVRRAVAAYASDARQADRMVIDAYLQGFEAVEPRLRARDSAGTLAVEAGFRDLRGAMARRDGAGVQAEAQALDRALARLQDDGRATVPMLAAFLIYLREGLEAALLVGALLAGLRRLGRSDAARWVHAGWVAALPAGVLTWWVLERVLHTGPEHRELMEALVALAAAAVLFAVSFWMISKVESRHWLGYLRGQLERSLGARKLGMLAGLSFLAVYREAAETVLFTQALLLDAPQQRMEVLAGCALGLLAVAALAVLMARAVVRLPLGPFFAVSGVLLCGLAVSFAGSGMYSLVAAGYLQPRPVAGPEVPWMGIYPDLAGLLVQSAILALMAAAAITTLRKRRPEASPQA